MKEVKAFFQDYKSLENKTVEIGEILGAEDAYSAVESAVALYQEKREALLTGAD